MFFDLPENFITEVTANMSGIIGDFMPIIVLIIGISIGLWLLSALIGVFRGGKS